MTRFALLAIAMLFTVPALAQDKPKVDSPRAEEKAPALDQKDKDTITAALEKRQSLITLEENYRLKAELTRLEIEKATKALQELVTSKTPEGYQLNDKLELVKIPKA